MAPTQIKVCGVTDGDELSLLEDAGVDYAGVWFGIDGSERSLDRCAFRDLTAGASTRVRCVGVTLWNEPRAIGDFLRGVHLPALQLHGFLLPGAIRQLRWQLGNDIEIFKVLHVRGERCLEGALLPSYLSCGIDAFIVDRFVSRDQIGSSGEEVPRAAVERVVDAVGAERVMVAGGLDEARIRDVRANLSVRGVDVDSAARVAIRAPGSPARGGLARDRVRALAAAAHGVSA